MAEFAEQDIIAQLGRITKHPSFVRSPRISHLLTYLVNEELSGRGSSLKGYTVGIEALGKKPDFDPSTDASVRVETGRLRRMLSNYYSEIDSDPIEIEIPKGSYRPVFSTLTIQHDDELTRATTPSAGPSLAVLGFEATTNDEQTKIFAIGVREEMLAELFQFREFHYLDASGIDPSDGLVEHACREDLEADFMLRGKLFTAGNRVVITLSVTDLAANRVIWVERFENKIDEVDLIECAREMAQEVVHKLVKPAGVILVKALQKRMGIHPARWTATDCILRWHFYRLLDRSPATHGALRTQIKRIIDADQMFPLGKIIYAMLKLDEAVYLLNPKGDAASSISRARYWVLSALSGDPDLAWGHYVKAQCDYFDNNVPGFKAAAEEAIRRNPRNTDLLHHIGVFMVLSGDATRGLDLMEKAGLRYHTGVGYRLGHILASYVWGEPGDAKELFETCMMPNELAIGQLAGCLAYLAADEVENAAACYRRLYELQGVTARSIDELITLWVKDPELKQKIHHDLNHLLTQSSVVIPIR